MDIVTPFHNPIEVNPILLTRESRHGKHRLGYIRPDDIDPIKRVKKREYFRLYMRKRRELEKSNRPKLTLQSLSKAKKTRLLRYWNCLDRPWSRFSNVKGMKKCLTRGWNTQIVKHTIPQILEQQNKNCLLILHNKKYDKPIYNDCFVGEVDIDNSVGFASLFSNTAYNSPRRGSVKYLFLYKKRNSRTKNRQQIGDCKFDFKTTGYTYVAGSTHQDGNLYDLKRSFRNFFINSNKPFESSEEAYNFVTSQIRQFVLMREQKRMLREQVRLQKESIEIPLM